MPTMPTPPPMVMQGTRASRATWVVILIPLGVAAIPAVGMMMAVVVFVVEVVGWLMVGLVAVAGVGTKPQIVAGVEMHVQQ